MRCGTVRKWLVEFATDGIDPARAAAFREHLGACPRCAAEWRAVESAGALLARLPAPPLDPRVESKLLDRIQTALDDEPAPRTRRAPWLRPVLQFGCVCLVAVLITRGLRPPAPAGDQHLAALPDEPAARNVAPVPAVPPSAERSGSAGAPPAVVWKEAAAAAGGAAPRPAPARAVEGAGAGAPTPRPVTLERADDSAAPRALRRVASQPLSVAERGAAAPPAPPELIRVALSTTGRAVPVGTILTSSAGAFTLAAVGFEPADERVTVLAAAAAGPAADAGSLGLSGRAGERREVVKDAVATPDAAAFAIDPAVLESDLVRVTTVAERSLP